jgi:hypothetical protein
MPTNTRTPNTYTTTQEGAPMAPRKNATTAAWHEYAACIGVNVAGLTRRADLIRACEDMAGIRTALADATAETREHVSANELASTQVPRITRDRYGREHVHTPHVRDGYGRDAHNYRAPFARPHNAVPAYDTTIRGVYGDPRTTWATNAELTGRDRVPVRSDAPRCAAIVRGHFSTQDAPCGLLAAPGSETCPFHIASTYTRQERRLPVALIDLGTFTRITAYITRHEGPAPIYVAPAGDIEARHHYAHVGYVDANLWRGADGYNDAMSDLWAWRDAGTAYAAEATERVERVAWCAKCCAVVGIDPCDTAGKLIPSATCEHKNTAGTKLDSRLDGPRADYPNTARHVRYAMQGTGPAKNARNVDPRVHPPVRVDQTPAVREREQTFRNALARKSHAWDIDARGRYVYRGVRKVARRSVPQRGVTRLGVLTYIGRWTALTRSRVANESYGRYGFRAYRGVIAPRVTALRVDSYDPRPAWDDARDVVWTGTRTAQGKPRKPRTTAATVAATRASVTARRAAKDARLAAARNRLTNA